MTGKKGVKGEKNAKGGDSETNGTSWGEKKIRTE